MKQDDPKVIFSWSLFDWANSAFTTIVVTFIYATYFTQAMATDAIRGTVLWSRAIAVSAILIAVLSPIVGTIADRGGRRRRYLIVTTAVCVVATAALTFVRPGAEGAVLIALTIFVVGNVAYETGLVCYNSFLPIIASPPKLGRISGYGWGLGYFGGLVCMVIAWVGFVHPETPWFGISTAEGFNVRATNLLTAVWFLVFSLPMLLFVRDVDTPRRRVDVAAVFRELRETFHAIRRFREVARFLLARMVYNDGLVTIFAFGGIYAAETFGMTLSEVMIFGIALNVAAGLGALVFGIVDDRIGGKKTVMWTLAALSVATILAVWAPTKTWLWVAGMLVGIFVGPNQAASRSLMARFVPARHQAQFFGFFAFSGKATSFLGPLLLGAGAGAFGSQRAGFATLLLFFVIGGLLLATVNEAQGIQAARSDAPGGRDR